MGRDRPPYHAIACLLALVLAGPWHLALAAVESPPVWPPTKQAVPAARAGHQPPQVVRPGKPFQTACLAVSPDFDASEAGDDSGVWPPWSLVLPPPDPPAVAEGPGRARAALSLRPEAPVPVRYRFRC